MAYYRTDGQCPLQHNAATLGEFIEACRGYMRVRRPSLRTEESYLFSIGRFFGRFFQFPHLRPPEKMGEAEVEAFLTFLRGGHNSSSGFEELFESIAHR